MTQIRPFCGLRPVPEYAAEIAALPYDVMDTEEARQILNKNPLSFLRVTKSEATMSDCIDPHSQAVYKMAKTNLDRYLSDGQMKKIRRPATIFTVSRWGSISRSALWPLLRWRNTARALSRSTS